MISLGIETSCDETSICLMRVNDVSKVSEILSLKTHSQVELHKPYGGVVPEISARDHIVNIKKLTLDCFKESKIEPNEIDVISVTNRPGLIGGLIVGVSYAKGLSVSLNKPIVYVNHLEGHMFTCNFTHGLEEKFYCLLISGGHTQTSIVNNLKDYKLIGKSLDDSAGESFDKISKTMGLGYPGGAIIEKLALKGDENRHRFNFEMGRRDYVNFSFSGLKTHFIKIAQKILSDILSDILLDNLDSGSGENLDKGSTGVLGKGLKNGSSENLGGELVLGSGDNSGRDFVGTSGRGLGGVISNSMSNFMAKRIKNLEYGTEEWIKVVERVKGSQEIWDLCASLQKVITDILIDRTLGMVKEHSLTRGEKFGKLVLCGGVASNKYIQKRFNETFCEYGIDVVNIPMMYCTDNAAMIANIGYMYARRREYSDYDENPANRI